MTKYEVIINGVSIDLYPNTVIAQSLKAIEIGDLTTRKFNFTNTIRVPSTPVNDGVFGIAWNHLSDTNIPYIKLGAKIKVNGIETVSDGIAQIISANSDYSINIISGAKSFFSNIEGKRLSDLTGFVLSNEDAARVAKRNATSGIVIPVAYYGDYLGFGTVNTGGAYIYDKSILDEIITNAGYTYAGNFLSNSRFEKQVTNAFANINGYVNSFIDARRAEAYVDTPQSTNVTNGGGTSIKEVEFKGVRKEGLNPFGYWDGTSKYLMDDSRIPALKIMYNVVARITVDITVPVGSTVNILGLGAVGVGSGTYSVDTILTNSGSPLGNGLSVAFSVRVQYNSSPGFIPIPFTINSGSIVIQPQAKVRYAFPATGSGTGINTYTDYAACLPDIEQKEFIRNIMMQYSLLPSEENGVLTFTSIEEVMNSKGSAPDWTNKRLKADDNLSFTPLSYAQINKFLYSNKDENVTEEYGGGSFGVANANATLSREVFKSVFSSCYGSVVNGLLVAYVPIFNNEAITGIAIFNIDPGFRNLLVRSKLSSEPSVTYPDGVAYSDYLAVYFDDPSLSDSMSFQQMLDENYDQFVEALQKAKIVTRRYKLNETDIAKLDFRLPIFDTDAYYLVNGISNYIPDNDKTGTAVELFKV